VTAFLVTASSLAHAQAPSASARSNAADVGTLTDMQINLVKAALQLTPDQEKYWPAIEEAIRAKAQDQEAAQHCRLTALGQAPRTQTTFSFG